MVNPSILFSVAPLAGYASALYLPHEDDDTFVSVAGDVPPSVSNDRAMAAAASQLGNSRSGKKGKGCAGMKKNKKSGKKTSKEIQLGTNDKPFKVETPKATHVLDVNGIISIANTENIIEDSYIVVLKDGVRVEDSVLTLAKESQAIVQNLVQSGQSHGLIKDESSAGFDITHIYNQTSFRGYAGKLLPQAAEFLASHPDVAFVERDSIVHAMKSKEEDQAPWGLARVSHRDPLGLGTYNKYLYDAEAGDGVTSYIVDTGIYIDHEDFEGRAVWGKTMPSGDTDVDAHGHGSHCAGTIGGKKYGVAKKAKLVAVKVLGSDGSGSMSDVIGGVEYVVESHRAEKKSKGSKLKGSTANMSLGGGKSPALDIAVNAATEAGVHFAVAAGNENQDACNTSPASAEGPVTVGATNVRDDRAYFSNYGKCVDIFAPGVNVLSVGTYSPSSTAVMSGTSMASPHIAGLLTYFVSLQPSTDSQYATRGTITTKELKKYLVNFGTSGVISDLDSESPNVLAYNGGGGDISSFWSASEDAQSDDEEEDDHHESFLHRVGDFIDDFADEVEASVRDLF